VENQKPQEKENEKRNKVEEAKIDVEQHVARKNRIQESMLTHELDIEYIPEIEDLNTPMEIRQPKEIKLSLWQKIKLKFGWGIKF